MGLYDHWPYTNFHELNLTWLLRRMEELSNTVENFVTLNTIKYADPIQWNITTQYETNTVVIDPQTGTAYISSRPVPSGIGLTNTDYWNVIFTLDVLSANQNITLRNDGSSILATFASAAGDWLIWNGILYKVSQAININEAYVVGYNLDRYTVELYIEDLRTDIETIIGDLADLNTTDKSDIVAAINEILTITGDLADLNTTDKSNLVAAINEVISMLGSVAKDFVNVLEYGFDNTGTDDNSSLISTLPTGKVWLFPAGVYLFNSPITLPSVRVLGYGATFKAGQSMGTFVTTTADYLDVTKNKGNFLKGVLIDGDYKVSVALNHTSGRVVNFADLTIKNFNSTGILISYGAGIYENIHINQEYAVDTDLPTNTIGIHDQGGDNAIINCSIVDVSKGIICSHGTNHINCYVWLSENYLYDGSIGYQINDNIYANFENCSVDTLQTGFYFNGSYNGVAANEITWVFNTMVVSDALIQSLATDTCLFSKLATAVVNRISLINSVLNVSNYHVKLLSDNLATTPSNVANTYALPIIRNIIGANIGNMSNVRSSDYHKAINNAVISSGYTISSISLTYNDDCLDGYLVLDKGDTTTEWNGAALFTVAGGVNTTYAPAYFSDNQYNMAGTLLIYYNGTNAGASGISGNASHRYMIVPIHLVCTMNGVM